MGELLGSVDLEVDVNLAPLDAGLARAKAKVALAAAEMQKLLDRHLDVHTDRLGNLGAALEARLTTPLTSFGGAVARLTTDASGAYKGLRIEQDQLAESLERTATVAVASSEIEVAAADRVTAAYLEQAAAAHLAADARLSVAGTVGGGFEGAAAAQAARGGGGGALAAAAALEGVRGKAHAGSRGNPVTTVLEAGRYTSLGSLAAAIAAQGVSGAPTATTVTEKGGTNVYTTQSKQPNQTGPAAAVATPSGGGGGEQREGVAADAALAAATAKLAEAMRPSSTSKTGGPTVIVPGDRSATHDVLISPAGKSGTQTGKPVPVIITDSDARASRSQGDALAAALADLAASRPSGGAAGAALGGAAGAGGGKGGLPPALAGLLWGSHGGGGKGRPPGWLGYLASSAGGFGAGFGSLGSFAGFGPEHIILTAGGIVGSGVAALGGGALLGAGALGKLAVGGGSDAAITKSTITDTKSLYAAYEAVTRAVAVYGKGSKQAIVATAELNYLMKELGQTAGVKAEEGVAKAAIALNHFWDQQTSGARVQASKVLLQGIGVGHAYTPLIAQAAESNLSVVNTHLKPFFDWLKGPEAMGIFLQLEDEFRSQIPEAMHAFDEGFQFLAKTVAYTAPLTGGFLKDLDRFFTKWNQPGQFSVWEGEINRLVNDFHVWGAFVKILGKDLFDLFNKDAHTGQSIIEVLTGMLVKLNEWENSTKGSAAIRNIFMVHREEVIALLKVLPPLISSFSSIYTTVAPPLVIAVTGIANAFAGLLKTIDEAGPLARWAIGLTLIAAKLKLLSPLLASLKTELLGTAAAETEAGTGALAAAGGASVYAKAVAAEEGAAGMESLGILGTAGGAGALAKGTLLRGGVAAAGGLLAGSLVAGATGARGTLGTAISAGGAGAGAGFVLGPAAGALLGTEIAPVVGTAIGAGLGFATPYAIKFLGSLFESHAPDYGKRFAEGFLSPFGALLGPAVGDKYEKTLEQAQNAVVSARESEAPHYTRTKGRGKAGAPRRSGDGSAVIAAERHLGEQSAKAFIEGQQHVRFPTKTALIISMEQSLARLPQNARASAAKAMIAYATELQAKGVLAKGAVSSMIHSLEAQFPGLTAALASGAKGFAHVFELREARAALRNSLDSISQQFGTSSADTIGNASDTMGELTQIIKHSTGVQKEAAIHAYEQLRRALLHQLELTRDGGGNLMEELSVRVALGLETTAQGISRINAQLASELHKLGAGKEVTAGLIEGKKITGKKGSELSSSPFKAAGGGVWQIGRPGEAGRDDTPLTVGGQNIVVGGGEVVAVFNRHQLPEVNAGLAERGYDGLGGLFSNITTPNYMATGGIVAPHVAMPGVIGDVVRAALSDVTKAANAKVRRTRPAVSASGGKAGGSAQMRAWAKAGLEAAGVPATPGNISTIVGRMIQESGGNPSSINLWDSNAAAGHPSQGLMQTIPETFDAYHVAGTSNNILDPVANVAAAVRYMLARYGHLVGSGPGGYSLGGMVAFAKGGSVGTHFGGKQPSVRRIPKHAKKAPKAVKVPFGKIPPVKFTSAFNADLAGINALLGEDGTVPRLGEEYELTSQRDTFLLSGQPHEGQFIFTPKGGGPQEIDQANVSLRVGQLEGLIHFQTETVDSLNAAGVKTQGVLKKLQEAVALRKKQIKELKARIEANLAAIKKHQEEIERQEAALKALARSKAAAIRRLRVGKSTPASRAAIAAIESGSEDAKGHLEATIASEKRAIRVVEEENHKLGGNKTTVGGGGNIGVLNTQIKALDEKQTTIKDDIHTIGGVSGHGGARAAAEFAREELQRQLSELGATPLAEKLAEGASTSEGSELLERQKAQLEERLKLSQEENLINARAVSVFGGPGDIGAGGATAIAAAAKGFAEGGLLSMGRLPYAGSFAAGGVVPGPLGVPMAAIVHGGEPIGMDGQGAPHIHFEQHNHMLHPSDPAVLTEIGKASVKGIGYQGNRPSKRIAAGV